MIRKPPPAEKLKLGHNLVVPDGFNTDGSSRSPILARIFEFYGPHRVPRIEYWQDGKRHEITISHQQAQEYRARWREEWEGGAE